MTQTQQDAYGKLYNTTETKLIYSIIITLDAGEPGATYNEWFMQIFDLIEGELEYEKIIQQFALLACQPLSDQAASFIRQLI